MSAACYIAVTATNPPKDDTPTTLLVGAILVPTALVVAFLVRTHSKRFQGFTPIKTDVGSVRGDEQLVELVMKKPSSELEA